MITEDMPYETSHIKGKFELRHIVGNDETKIFIDTEKEVFDFLFSHCHNDEEIVRAKKFNYAKDDTGTYFVVLLDHDVQAHWVEPVTEEEPVELATEEVIDTSLANGGVIRSPQLSADMARIAEECVDSALRSMGCL